MVKYIAKRLLLMVLTFFVIITICFVMIKMLPVPLADIYGNKAEIIAARRELLGYNKPIIVQYFIFLTKSLLGGNWGLGESLLSGQDVLAVFQEKLPATMFINFYSLIISIPLGIALGIFAALFKNKWQDHLTSTAVMIMVSVPSFVFAFLIQHFLCFKLGWFPLIMDAGYNYLSFSMIRSMMPAILSLAFGTIASFTRTTRAELTEVMTNDYMLLARTKGLSRLQATKRHAFRNCMIVVVPSILGNFISVLVGSLIIESIFSIPGIGSLLLNSINSRDYNFFMLLMCFYTLVNLLAGIVIDISYSFIDPRVRVGAKK